MYILQNERQNTPDAASEASEVWSSYSVMNLKAECEYFIDLPLESVRV